MPVVKTNAGYKWGNSGKVYPTKDDAERQGRAIEAAKTRKLAEKRGGYKWGNK